MGSLFGVKIFYTELKHFFDKISDKISVYGTYMRAESIYTSELDKNAVIILGNEANGISQQISKFVTKKISIPSFNQNKTAESLNVAIATAIICSEFKRR
jgi:TrmH family RNA methyltransferase